MAGNAVLAFPQPPLERPLLVGCSGGLDSTVLLHRLAGDPALRRQGLRAIHVHHGLHPDADGWARHCGRECRGLGIALDVVEVDVARDSGSGLEAAARTARHAAFESTLRDGEVLVLAHHLDDQAETFLLRALRASGSDGLGAMRAWRAFGRGWLWRPLLDTPRARLYRYAQAHSLRWLDDPANASDIHDRNFLRNRVMPLLRERWPQANAAFARSAGLQQESIALLDDGDAQALAQVRGVDPSCIDAAKLADLPAPRRARVLRRWIADRGLPPLPARGVARIERDLLPAARDSIPVFAWHGAVVRRWRDLLWAERSSPPLPPGFRAAWDGSTPLDLPTGHRLSLTGTRGHPADTTSATPWIVHARDGGERIALPGRRHTHALKHVLQDLGIPPWMRRQLPLLSSVEGTLLAAGDLLFSDAFAAWLEIRGRQLHWRPSMP